MDGIEIIISSLIATAVALLCGFVKKVCKKIGKGEVSKHDDQ